MYQISSPVAFNSIQLLFNASGVEIVKPLERKLLFRNPKLMEAYAIAHLPRNDSVYLIIFILNIFFIK